MTTLNRGVRWLAVAFVSASLLVSAVPAFAQEVTPDQLALARKYVDLTDKVDVYGTSIVDMAAQTLQQILRLNPAIGDQATAAVTDVVKGYKARRSDLIDQMARVYAQQFTADELQQIVTFYSSPVGQKLATANLGINQQLTKVMQLFQANLSNEFYAKVRAELKDKGIQL